MRLLHHLDTHDQNVYGAVLTTFPFSARFFERVILPLLTAKSTGQNNVVFLDRAFYERTLERSSDETRPRRAGRDYYLAPVPTPAQRAFHPKVFFFGGRRYAAAYIGSANLTQQALTRNREVVTYVDCVAPSSEAESDSELEPAMQQRAALLEEIRQFVARLPMLEGAAGIGTIPTERVAAITDAAGWTEAYMAVENRRRWFLHNLDRPILKQLFERLESNDEVPARASLSAPFYGGSMVVPKAFTDRGIETTLWLQNDSTQIDREALEEWLDHPEAAVRVYHDSRYTHGKVLQVETDTTRYTLAGSPNLSAPALLTTGPGNGNGNVEAAILRIQGRAANEGLFATKPFVDAATNITGFTSVDTSSPGREDPDRDPPTVVLSNAEFWQAHGYAKGTLELSATVPAFETPPDVALCVTGPEDADERLGIEPHHIERHADSEDSDAAETGNAAIIMQLSVQNGAESPPLHQGGRVRLK
jgi:HKD family nuclease